MNPKGLKEEFQNLKQQALIGFPAFRKYYFSHLNRIPDAEFHQWLSHNLEVYRTCRGRKFALAAPRGSGKSAIISTQYIVYCLCTGSEKFIILLSRTQEQASAHLQAVKTELQTNPKLIEDFPQICETKPKPPRWTQFEIQTRNRIKVTALGIDQEIRGRKNADSRPTLIIADDIEADRDLINKEASNNLYDWFTKSVLKVGTPETNVILTGTLHHFNSVLARFTDQTLHPGWSGGIVPMVVSWPVRMDLWENWIKIYNGICTCEGKTGPEAARFYYEHCKEEMLSGARILWPQKYSFYDLMVMREQDGHASFDSEMQNQPVNPADCLFNSKEMIHWEDDFKTEAELLSAIGPYAAEFYGACDPSLGRDNKTGDDSAIITLVRSLQTGKVYILDADIKKRTPDQLVEDVLSYCQHRRYIKFAFEANHFQGYLAERIETLGNQRRIYPRIEKITNTQNKIARIGSLQMFFKRGTLRLSRKHSQLFEQLKCFPKGRHDDGPDALEMAFRMLYTPPKQTEPRLHVLDCAAGKWIS